MCNLSVHSLVLVHSNNLLFARICAVEYFVCVHYMPLIMYKYVRNNNYHRNISMTRNATLYKKCTQHTHTNEWIEIAKFMCYLLRIHLRNRVYLIWYAMHTVGFGIASLTGWRLKHCTWENILQIHHVTHMRVSQFPSIFACVSPRPPRTGVAFACVCLWCMWRCSRSDQFIFKLAGVIKVCCLKQLRMYTLNPSFNFL